MSDLVKREAVLTAINCWIGSSEYRFTNATDYLNARIKELPAEPSQKLIPVSEKLPEEHTCDDGFIESSEYVLVQLKSRYMEVSRYWGNNEKYKDHPWIDLSYPIVDEVVAWMPLPPLYTAESEEL